MRWTAIALGLGALAGTARADRPRERARVVSLDAGARRDLVARGWHVDAGGGWVTHLALPAPGAVDDPAAAERAVRAAIPAIARGTTSADWIVIANRRDGDKRTVALRQTYRGIPVVDGQLDFVIARDRIFAIATRARPDVGARLAAISPTAGTVVLATAAGGYALARTVTDGGPITRYVDATTGAVLEARDRRRFETGQLLYNAPVRYPGGERRDYPAASATVALTADATSATTDPAGVLTWSTPSPLAISTAAAGPSVTVAAITGDSHAALALPDGGTATWNAAASETTDAEISAFIHASLGKLAAARIVPAIAAWLATPLAISVDATDTDCNAFTDTDGLHFFRATATCENTGRLADVVLHELGHAIHMHASIPAEGGALDSALGEGVADFNAANDNADSGVGRGFHFTDAPLRDLDPYGRDLRWPDDTHANADVHATGLIAGGALWDLRALALATLGETAGRPVWEGAYRGVLERAADIPSTYTAALVEDDDDGDLANGTPHGCLIGEAFARHGLAPEFPTTTVGTPAIAGLAIDVPTTTPAVDSICPVPAITAVTVHYHGASGPTADLPLAPAAGGHYTGAIPAAPGLVYFTIDVALDNGLAVRLPSNLADPEYTAFAGTVTPLYCTHMDADPAWTTSPAGAWQLSSLPATPFPDPQAAHTGSSAFGTALSGAGLYPASAALTATLPPVDTAGFTNVHLQYYRWLTVEDGTYDQATITANGAPVWANAIGGGALDHADREWRFQDVDLSAHLAGGGPLSVAFTLTSDELGELGGWTLDDVCIVAYGPGCGDGIVEAGEECDDGNRADGDGCAANCTEELPPTPPIGGCCQSTNAPSPAIALGLLLFVRRRRRAT